MANIKITDMGALTGADLQDVDLLPIVDLDTNNDGTTTDRQNKSITIAEFKTGIFSAPIVKFDDTNSNLTEILSLERKCGDIDTANSAEGGFINLRVTDNNNEIDAARINWRSDNDPNVEKAGRLSFSTAEDVDGASVSTEHLTIRRTGDIGIGTTSPQAKLEIQSSLSQDAPLLRLHNTSNANGATIQFNDYATGTSQDGHLTYEHQDAASQGGGASFHFTGEADLTLVVGNATNKGRMVVSSAGSSTEVDYGFYDNVNMGMSRMSTNELGLITAGIERVRIDSAGRVGIGDTNPDELLTVSGDSNPKIHIRNESEDDAGIKFSDDDDVSGQHFEILHNSDNTHDLRIKSNSTDNILFMQEDGKVGIGDIAPDELLTVRGSSNPKIHIKNSEENDAGIKFSDDDDIAGQHFEILHNSATTNTTLRIKSNDTDNILFMQEDGKVGIGTNTPQALLHISSEDADTSVATLRLESDVSNTNNTAGESRNPLIEMRQDGGSVGVNIGFDQTNFGSNRFGIGTRFGNVDNNNVIKINTSNGIVDIESLRVRNMSLLGSLPDAVRFTNPDAAYARYNLLKQGSGSGNVIQGFAHDPYENALYALHTVGDPDVTYINKYNSAASMSTSATNSNRYTNNGETNLGHQELDIGWDKNGIRWFFTSESEQLQSSSVTGRYIKRFKITDNSSDSDDLNITDVQRIQVFTDTEVTNDQFTTPCISLDGRLLIVEKSNGTSAGTTTIKVFDAHQVMDAANAASGNVDVSTLQLYSWEVDNSFANSNDEPLQSMASDGSYVYIFSGKYHGTLSSSTTTLNKVTVHTVSGEFVQLFNNFSIGKAEAVADGGGSSNSFELEGAGWIWYNGIPHLACLIASGASPRKNRIWLLGGNVHH